MNAESFDVKERWEFGAGHKKTRPPIGGTPGGLALPDKGRGNRGMSPLSSCSHLKAETLGSPLYLGTMALVLWLRAKATTPRVFGLTCDSLSQSVATGWPRKANLWQH